MARVVQCPACGEAHPLDTLAGTPTFACTGCGRTLRTPTELVRPSGTTPAVRATPKAAPKPVAAPAPARPPRSRAGAAGAAARSNPASSPQPQSRRSRTSSGVLTLPVRIGAWIVAVVLGLLLTWVVASAFGFISRAQLVDMFRSSSAGNYIRLFLLIPVWAFMSACLSTAFIEGAWLYLARQTAAPEGARRRPPRRPSLAAGVADPEERRPEPGPPRDPQPPGQRTRIRPREPTV